MDIKEIQNLIKFVSKTGVNEVSIEQGEFKITIKADLGTATEQQVIVQAPPVAVQSAPVVAAPVAAAPAAEAPATPASDASGDESNYITIKSPMIGTFYRRPSPDKDIFVNVWDSISPCDVICIV